VAATIGGIGVFSLTPFPIHYAAPHFEETTPPGSNGVAYTFTGIKGDVIEAESEAHLTSGAYLTTYNAYNALTGSVITITDDNSGVSVNMMVLRVQILDYRPVSAANPSSVVGILRCAWQFQNVAF